ncbi:hypothetical protein Moror_5495 [Moniliophthora roreri MCA 2997]|uniref:Uncharacterized protein n=1 Tax=Moniliophthora roreri (strain MCA 2997) TaxID=1381753 RepID=V2X6Z5_MONRO|nr:hypothetical protein Moror_5495 [Moniliophthora roreri MCA 2997]
MAANGIDGCADGDLNWYINTIGETPCRTLERLRQVCNPPYRIPKLNSNLPPTTCNDQNVGCCCNSIAFSLTMFCLTCQTGAGSSRIGYDAPAGTYAKYINSCSPTYQKALPDDIQSSVCSANIKLYDGFYNRVFWSDGSWFYRWSSDFLSGEDKAIKACPAPSPPPPTSTSTSSSETANTNTPPPPTTSEEQTPPTATTTKSEESPSTPTVTVTESQRPNSSAVTSQVSQSSFSASDVGAPTSVTSSGIPSSSRDNTQQQQQPSRGLSMGALAGVIVGVIVLLFLVILLAWCIRRTLKERRPTPVRSTEGLTPYEYETAERVSGARTVTSVLTDTSGSQSSQSQLPLVSRKGQQFYSTSSSSPASLPVPPSSSTTSGRIANDTHEDAGPVPHALNRSPSGRLPPDYGRLPPAYGDGQ